MPETWRQGRKSGHNIYLQTGERPADTDRQIGSMFDPANAAAAVEAVDAVERITHYLDDIETYCSAERRDVPAWVLSVRVRLAAPHGPAEPVSPVSTPTEAHGETGEAQEG